jgi:HK97 family phage prohead protease
MALTAPAAQARTRSSKGRGKVDILQTRIMDASSSQLRAERQAGGGQKIVGYAAVFWDSANVGTQYHLGGDMVERLQPGCFDRALRERQDCRALFNHDVTLLLGRTAAGTCRLSVDKRGLRYEVAINQNTQVGRDVAAHLARGDLSGSSFSFRPTRTKWGKDKWPDGTPLEVCEVYDLDLYDVGPCCFPAYPATTAEVQGSPPDDGRAKPTPNQIKEEKDNLARYWRLQYLAEAESELLPSALAEAEAKWNPLAHYKRRQELAEMSL